MTPQQLMAHQLYCRTIPRTGVSPSTSSRLSHLLMAYAADSTNPTVQCELGLFLYTQSPEQGLNMAEQVFGDLKYEFHTGLDLLKAASMVQDWDRVDRIAKELLAQRPSDTSLKRLLINLYGKAGKPEKALAFVQSIEKEEKDPYVIFEEADLLQKLGRAKEAIDVLEPYMESNPRDAIGAYMLIALYADEKMYDKALPLLQEAQKFNPDNLYLANLAVGIYSLLDDHSALCKEVLRVATLEGSNPIAIQELLDMARKNSPNLTQLLPTLIDLDKQLVGLYPEVDQLALTLANDYFLRSDTLEGEQVLRQLVNQGTELPSPYYYFIEKLANAEDIEGLRLLTNKGLKSLPKEGAFHFYKALVDINSGDTLAYNKQIETAVAVVPEEDRLYGQLALMRGEIALNEDKWEEAVPYFEKAVEKGVPMAYNNYAYFLTLYGTPDDLNKAEELSRQAVQFDSESPSYLDTYAWVLYLKKAYPLARIYMERAIKFGSADGAEVDPLYYHHYADILIALKEYDKAIEALEKAIALTPKEEVEDLREMEQKLKETKQKHEQHETE